MSIKSGNYWVSWANVNAQNSIRIEDLDPSFQTSVHALIAALEHAGARVSVTATKRDQKRAYLFHWSWKIFTEKCKPSDPNTMVGVDIQWDHGDLAKSKAGAGQMVTGFGLATPPRSTVAPALVSNHIAGKAVDMDITWTGEIKVKNKDDSESSVTFSSNVNTNVALHAVGATYGVKKLVTDAPHWSFNGR